MHVIDQASDHHSLAVTTSRVVRVVFVALGPAGVEPLLFECLAAREGGSDAAA
jgi:hypothetical protein